jgi:hypothetical protein
VLSAKTIIVLSVLTNVENGLGVPAKAPNSQIQPCEWSHSPSTPATVSVVSGLVARSADTGGAGSIDIKLAPTVAVVEMASVAADASSSRFLPALNSCVVALGFLAGLFALAKVDPQFAQAA